MMEWLNIVIKMERKWDDRRPSIVFRRGRADGHDCLPDYMGRRMMTDTPPEWTLLELANRGGRRWIVCGMPQPQAQYIKGDLDDFLRALRDMILKHEQPPYSPEENSREPNT